MDARQKAKEKQMIKARNRAKCCPPKAYRHAPEIPEPTQSPNIPRSLMVNKLKQETKAMLQEQGTFVKHNESVAKLLPSRQERRLNLLDLARATLRSLRAKGVQQAPKS